MLKDTDFYHLQGNIKKQKTDTGPNSLKTASKYVFHKAGEFIGNKTSDIVTKSNDVNIEKQEPAEKIIIPPEKMR